MRAVPEFLLTVTIALSGIGSTLAKDPVELIIAEQEIDPAMLVDVGIRIFDPGLPEDDESEFEEEGVFPEVRKSEARYMAFQLKNTLEASGHWGAVRVLPASAQPLDLNVTGEIVESTGLELTLQIKVVDATGRGWRSIRRTSRVTASRRRSIPFCSTACFGGDGTMSPISRGCFTNSISTSRRLCRSNNMLP